MPRVFGGDKICPGKHRDRAKRDIGEITDRGGHKIKTGWKRSCEKIGERLACASYDRAGCPLVWLSISLVLHARGPQIRLARHENVT